MKHLLKYILVKGVCTVEQGNSVLLLEVTFSPHPGIHVAIKKSVYSRMLSE